MAAPTIEASPLGVRKPTRGVTDGGRSPRDREIFCIGCVRSTEVEVVIMESMFDDASVRPCVVPVPRLSELCIPWDWWSSRPARLVVVTVIVCPIRGFEWSQIW